MRCTEVALPVALAVLMCLSPLAGQDVRPVAMIVREQARSIAEEVLGGIECNSRNRVVVSVESRRLTSVVENAFLEVLQNKGCRGGIGEGKDTAETQVRILVLDETLSYNEIHARGFLRTIRTRLEVRIGSEGGDFRILGSPTRAFRDTVESREEVQLMAGAAKDEQSALWQRVLSPMIVIGSSVLLIYLFFTVRN